MGTGRPTLAGSTGFASAVWSLLRMASPIAVAFVLAAAACSGDDRIEIVTEKNFGELLTLDGDIGPVLAVDAPLNVDIRDTRQLAVAADASLLPEVESWYTMTVETHDHNKFVIFSVVDFTSLKDARDRLDSYRRNVQDWHLVNMDPPIGDASIEVLVNEIGVGAMVVAIKGDKVVTLHTAQPDGSQHLVELEDLKGLVRIVMDRLR